MKKDLYKKFISIIFVLWFIFNPISVTATGNINELQNKSNALQQELELQQSELVSILTQIKAIEEDIAINQAEIAQAEEDLAEALLAEQRQYEAMCKRIRYNYENKEDSLFTIMLTSQSVTDFFNQVEYANSIHEYDDLMYDSYQATRIAIEELKADLEARKAALAVQQENLKAKKSQLNTIIANTKARKQDVDTQLEKAREEAARRAREEAAARAAARGAANSAAVTGGNFNPAPVTGTSGSAVVGYASQFVGNPYVWGGNSLTDGCDCSGFVVQVYKSFGINLSGARSSAALRGVGQEVSYENMQAGDIVCYPGHVGIYTGAGTIVEAQSTRAGITNNRSVQCKTILAIRRVI